MAQELDQKLKIHRLSEQERKNLFHKFVEAGGKVVDRTKKGSLPFDREKQKELLAKLKIRKGKIVNEDDLYEIFKEEEIETTPSKTLPKRGAWTRFIIYFKGLYHQVLQWTGVSVSDSFFKFFKSEVVPNIKNLHYIVKYIFSLGDNNIKEISKFLDTKESYYFLLLKKYLNLFEEEEYNAILYFGNKKRYKKVKPKYLEEPLKRIFKKIYIIKGYMNGSWLTLKSALYITSKNKDWDIRLYQRRLKQIKHSLNIIYLHLLPKLYTLLLLILNENFPLNSKKMEEYLSLKEDDRVTFDLEQLEKKEKSYSLPLPEVPLSYKLLKQEEIKYIKKVFQELNEDDFKSLELDEITAIGIRLMQQVNFEKIFQENKDIYKLEKCSKEDKILWTFILFKEFEKEYSFVLTTHMMIIKPFYDDNTRVNYKDKLSNLYSPLAHFNELCRDYFDMVNDLDILKHDDSMTEINRYNRTTALEGKRSKLGYEIKNEMLKYYLELKENLDKFINDYNQDKRIIENPDDELNFDQEIEGIKKVEGKKVIDAIIEIDAFISAFIFRLEDWGDLSGIANDLKIIEVPEIMVEPLPEGEKAEVQPVSFLDELQDTLDKRTENT